MNISLVYSGILSKLRINTVLEHSCNLIYENYIITFDYDYELMTSKY